MTPRQIQNIAADYFQVPVSSFLKYNRRPNVVRQRWLAIDLLHEHCPRMSLAELAEHFGMSDNKASAYAIARVAEELPLYPDMRRHHTELRRRLAQATVQPS